MYVPLLFLAGVCSLRLAHLGCAVHAGERVVRVAAAHSLASRAEVVDASCMCTWPRVNGGCVCAAFMTLPAGTRVLRTTPPCRPLRTPLSTVASPLGHGVVEVHVAWPAVCTGRSTSADCTCARPSARHVGRVRTGQALTAREKSTLHWHGCDGARSCAGCSACAAGTSRSCSRAGAHALTLHHANRQRAANHDGEQAPRRLRAPPRHQSAARTRRGPWTRWMLVLRRWCVRARGALGRGW